MFITTPMSISEIQVKNDFDSQTFGSSVSPPRAPASPMSNCWAWGVQQRLAASDCAEHVTALARCCREVGDGGFFWDQVAFFVIKNDPDISKWFNMDMEFQAPTFPWRVWCFGLCQKSQWVAVQIRFSGFCLGRPTWIVGRSWTPGARWTRKAGQQCLRGPTGAPPGHAGSGCAVRHGRWCALWPGAGCGEASDETRPQFVFSKTSGKGVELLMTYISFKIG